MAFNRIKHNSNDIIQEQLVRRAKAIESFFSADLLFYRGPITPLAPDLIKDTIEAISKKFKKLIFILETPGGYIDVAKRIAELTRHYYSEVIFIVPNYAMSAGTILVMSGDSIYMDYYSVLGPIDPQVERPGGGRGLIPALGYLIQYERLIEKSKKQNLTTAEMAYLIEKFDPAELYRYEQERELSISLLKEWLVKYKFKNWNKTTTRHKLVTQAMKTRRASEIAKKLNDTEKWHSHSWGISMQVLQKDLGLKIEDFGAIGNLNRDIKNYYKLVIDYAEKRSHSIVLHCKEDYFGIDLS